jgi:aldehyde dehydrogenase (NAD+)
MQEDYLKLHTLDVCRSWLDGETQNRGLKHFIDGDWVDGEGEHRYLVVDPSRKSTLAEFASASSRQVDQCVSSCQKAFNTWKGNSSQGRAKLLYQIAELIRKNRAELATLESMCNGKLFVESYLDDIPECASIFEYYAGWANKIYGETAPVDPRFINYTRKEPIGVCGLIVPWNFPLYQAALKLAPALVTGNSTVIKPSEYTPLSLVRLMQLIDSEIDLPKGLVNVVLGGAEVGQALAYHSGIRKISFTGSSDVGRSIVAASAKSNMKRITLELGGKSPNIFFEDTPNPDKAFAQSFKAMFSHKGEKCSEPTRFIVHSSLYDQCLDSLSEMAGQVVCGNQFDAHSQQGPQCNEKQYNKILEYIEAGILEDSVRHICGGRYHDERGYYISPTIFADVGTTSSLFQDEIFGPVLCVSKFEDEDEAVALANCTRYGLAAGFWTKDISRAHRIADKLEAGMVFINNYGCYDLASPFGGVKESGWGRELAAHSLDSYTQTKSIWIKVGEGT